MSTGGLGCGCLLALLILALSFQFGPWAVLGWILVVLVVRGIIEVAGE